MPDLGKRFRSSISGASDVSMLSRLSSTITGQTLGRQSSFVSTMTKKKDEILEISIILKYMNYNRQELNVQIHKSRDVSDLYSRAKSWMVDEFDFRPDLGQEFVLLYKNKRIDKNVTLKAAGLETDSKVFVQIIDDDYDQVEEDLTTGQDQSAPKAASGSQPDHNQYPKPPKKDYKVEPSMEKLLSMTIDELKAVDDLTVSNEFGSVQFLGPTDVTNVDLADLITISKSNLEVYDDERHKEVKPPVG